VRSLCGAGQVATILHQAKCADRSHCLFDVTGIGMWNAGDSHILQRMLNPDFNVGHTPHRLAYDETTLPRCRIQPDDTAKLYSLAPDDRDTVVGTTRVIRIYQHRTEKIELERRIDWELPLTESNWKVIRRNIPTALKALHPALHSIHHILLKDLGKGVICQELIEWLSDNTDADWYISSKEWRPLWLQNLPNKRRVKLILVPQLAAQSAINSGQMSSSSWVTPEGVPSEDAITHINKFRRDFHHSKIVVLPHGMTVLARDMDKAFVLAAGGDTHLFTPMASVFFPALSAHLICDSGTEFFTALRNAHLFTEAWRTSEASRTKDDWMPMEDQTLRIPYAPPIADSMQWREYSWGRIEKEWAQALSGIGVVSSLSEKKKRKDEFQLWRAMTEVPGYVTCVPSKRKHVLTLLREGRSLQQTLADDRKNKNFYLLDSPGSGKSFLVNCLASTLGMPLLKFNLTSLSTRQDLIECFQRISAFQGEHPDSILMVFFDEMNSNVANQPAYEVFLEPLEDGSYVYNGRTFYLKPCMWLFAGTAVPEVGRTSNKWPDFESRLTSPIMDLAGRRERVGMEENKERMDQLRMVEQVYIGVATVCAAFPDVTKISRKVLEAFSLMNIETIGPRGIRRLVQRFRYVQYGRVMATNLPVEWEKQAGVEAIKFEHWKKEEDSEKLLVDVIRAIS